jgi:hypothetical protein
VIDHGGKACCVIGDVIARSLTGDRLRDRRVIALVRWRSLAAHRCARVNSDRVAAVDSLPGDASRA